MKTPALLLPRPLALALGVAGLLALSGCMDHQPLDPNRSSPLFDHDLSGALLSGTGSTNVTDGVFTFSDWENADPVSFPLATASGTTTATLRVMNNATHLFVSARTSSPLSGNNQDVFEIRLELDGKVNVFGLRFGDPFDEHCTLEIVEETEELTSCGPDAISNTQGQRLGAGGGTTYEVSFPLADDLNEDDLSMPVGTTVNLQVSFSPANAATTIWPSSGWAQILIEDADDVEAPFDDPNKPNVVVTVIDPTPNTSYAATCDVSVVLRSELEYRLQRAARTSTPGVCQTTFYDVEPGSRPVYSALNGVLESPAQRELWPFDGFIPKVNLPVREGAVFIHDEFSSDYSAGESHRLIPLNYYEAYRLRKDLPTDGSEVDLTITLQNGFGKKVDVSIPNNPLANVFAVLPFDPDKVFPVQGQGTPGGGIFANTTGSPAEMIVAFDPDAGHTEETVFTAIDDGGNVYSNTWDGTSPEVTLYLSPSCFHSEYAVDPWGDGHPDGGLLTYCTLKNANGDQIDTFVANLKVRGLITGKKGSYSRWQLELIYVNPATLLEETIKALVHCNADSACTLQEVQPRRGKVITTGDFGEVDTVGNGYVQVPVDFTGITEARLRWRSADNDSGNDFVPNDGLTDLSKNIVNGFALWKRPTLPSTSWSVRF